MAADTRIISFIIKNETLKKVDDLSYKYRMTRSDLIRDALRSFLAKVENTPYVKDIYNIALCDVEIRRDKITGEVLCSERAIGQKISDIAKFNYRKVKTLSVEHDKLVIVI